MKEVSLKKSLLLAVLLALPVAGFSAVGKNNFTINVGVGSSSVLLNTYTPSLENLGTMDTNVVNYWGMMASVELGHLFLSQGKLVHSLDTRLGFNMGGVENIDGSDSMYSDTGIEPMSFYAGTTYAMGFRAGKGTLLFDIIGFNLGYFTGDMIYFKEGSSEKLSTTKSGGAMLVSFNLPLGTQYVFDNGLMLGFRHKVDTVIGYDPEYNDDFEITSGSIYGHNTDKQSAYLAYNLTVSV